jgi:hypothetical protein
MKQSCRTIATKLINNAMKKITFFLFTVIMASSASAQSQNENRENAIAMDEQGNVNTMVVTNEPAADAVSAVNMSAAVRRASADGTSIIYDQPQGEVRYYAQNDSAYKAYLSWKAFGKEEGVVAKLVFDGDDVYYRNPVTTFLSDRFMGKGQEVGRHHFFCLQNSLSMNRRIRMAAYPHTM